MGKYYMEGIIKIKNVPVTCDDCFLYSYAVGCRCNKKKFEGFKTTRPSWCPIEPNTYRGWKLEVEKEDTHG